jgi:hypothetical protein
MAIKDTRMMVKAVEQRWPMSPEYREAVIRRLIRIVADPKSSNREATAAARALMAAEQQNQSDEHKVVDVRVTTRHDEISAIAADLGIAPSLIESLSGEADTGFDSVAPDSQQSTTDDGA